MVEQVCMSCLSVSSVWPVGLLMLGGTEFSPCSARRADLGSHCPPGLRGEEVFPGLPSRILRLEGASPVLLLRAVAVSVLAGDSGAGPRGLPPLPGQEFSRMTAALGKTLVLDLFGHSRTSLSLRRITSWGNPS